MAPVAPCVADRVVADSVAHPATDLRVDVAADRPASEYAVAGVDAVDTSRTERSVVAYVHSALSTFSISSHVRVNPTSFSIHFARSLLH